LKDATVNTNTQLSTELAACQAELQRPSSQTAEHATEIKTWADVLQWERTEGAALEAQISHKKSGSYAVYDKGWSCIEAAFIKFMFNRQTKQRNPGTSLASMMNVVQLSGCDAGGQLYPTFNTKPGVGPTPVSGYLPFTTVQGKRIPLPGIFAFGGYLWVIAHSVLTSVYTDTQAIVETGCGFGRNLWNMINHGVDADIDLYCMEFTSGGRKLARLVSKMLVLDHKVTVLPITYLDADFSDILAKKYQRVTLITMTSIEQVETIPDSFVERVLSIAPQVDVVHVEPVGWQMRNELRVPTRQGAQPGNTDKNSGVQTNQNLWPLLRKFEDAGKLVIDEADPEMCGWGFAEWGVYSLIRWHKKRGSEVGAVAEYLQSGAAGPVRGSIGGPCTPLCGTIRPSRKEIETPGGFYQDDPWK